METLKTKTITEKYIGITNTYSLIRIGNTYKVLDGMIILNTFKGIFAKFLANRCFNNQ